MHSDEIIAQNMALEYMFFGYDYGREIVQEQLSAEIIDFNEWRKSHDR